MSLNLFKDVIASLNTKEPGNLVHTDSPEEALQTYAPFIVNRNFSQDRSTIGYAAIANSTGMSLLPKEAQYDFYYTALPKVKRFTRWAKPDTEEQDIKVLMDLYKYSRKKAEAIYPLFTAEQMEALRKKLTIGRESK